MGNKNMKFTKSKFSKFMASKGFYAAIAVCLAGAGAATWLAVDRTISGIENANNQILQDNAGYTDFPLSEEVEVKQPDIPRVSAPSSSASIPPSSSAPSSRPPEPSAAPSEPARPVEAPPPPQTLVYSLPIAGDVINRFSDGELVKNITLGDWRTHDGIDIAADKGDDVYAAAAGVVTEIRNDPLWGTVISISHIDGKLSIYSGLSATVPVTVGENVMARQVIGRVEGVPCEDPHDPHIHFAIRHDGKWLDPLAVVGPA